MHGLHPSAGPNHPTPTTIYPFLCLGRHAQSRPASSSPPELESAILSNRHVTYRYDGNRFNYSRCSQSASLPSSSWVGAGASRCQFLPLLKRSIKGHPAIRLRRWVLPRCSGRRGSDPSPRKCSGLKTTMTHSERQMGIPTRRLESGRDDGPTLSSIDRRSIPFFQLRRSIISGVPDRRYVHQSSKLYDGGL